MLTSVLLLLSPALYIIAAVLLVRRYLRARCRAVMAGRGGLGLALHVEAS